MSECLTQSSKIYHQITYLLFDPLSQWMSKRVKLMKKHNKINQKMRTLSSPTIDTQLPSTDDIGVNVTSTSTQEATLSNLIADPTNHKLMVEHPSPPSLPSDEVVSTNQVQQPLISYKRSHHFVSKLESCSHNQVQMSSCSQKSWRSAHTNYIRTHHCPDRKATNILWAWCMWVTKNLHLLTLCQRQVVRNQLWTPPQHVLRLCL